MKKWSLFTQGREIGPMPWDQFSLYLTKNPMNPDALVTNSEILDWQKPHQFPELRPFLTESDDLSDADVISIPRFRPTSKNESMTSTNEPRSKMQVASHRIDLIGQIEKRYKFLGYLVSPFFYLTVFSLVAYLLFFFFFKPSDLNGINFKMQAQWLSGNLFFVSISILGFLEMIKTLSSSTIAILVKIEGLETKIDFK